MVSNDKMFELMTQMYSEMQNGFKNIENRFEGIEGRLESVEGRLESVENTLFRIEQDHGNKLEALFDGYKQNAEKLNRIEIEVIKHEKFILKMMK